MPQKLHNTGLQFKLRLLQRVRLLHLGEKLTLLLSTPASIRDILHRLGHLLPWLAVEAMEPESIYIIVKIWNMLPT